MAFPLFGLNVLAVAGQVEQMAVRVVVAVAHLRGRVFQPPHCHLR